MSAPINSARQRVIEAFIAMGKKGDVPRISAHTGLPPPVVAGAFSMLRKLGRIQRIGTYGKGRGSYGIYRLLDEAAVKVTSVPRRPPAPPPRIWPSVFHGGL